MTEKKEGLEHVLEESGIKGYWVVTLVLVIFVLVLFYNVRYTITPADVYTVVKPMGNQLQSLTDSVEGIEDTRFTQKDGKDLELQIQELKTKVQHLEECCRVQSQQSP